MAVISYSVEVTNSKNLIKDVVNTLSIYNKALNYVVNICDIHYLDYKDLLSLNKRMYIEHLIHSTKNNEAKYKEFDQMFYKLPSYMLRDIETCAVGHVSSYKSNLKNYQEERYNNISNGLKFKKKEPQLGSCNTFPTFYKNNTYINGNNDKEIYLKIFKDNTWKYERFCLKERDLKKLRNINSKRYNPQIYVKGKKIYIKFIYEAKTLPLCDKNKENKLICGIDLGVNTTATLCIMKSDGTIIGRHFIKSRDKDQLFHLLNRKRKIERQSGNYKYIGNLHINNKIKSIGKNIVDETSSEIIRICLSYGVDVIVFENLKHKFKKAKKNYRQKLHHWRKISLLNKTEEMAHRVGIRISTVNPAGTSKNAYDGSGEVIRGSKAGFTTNSICRFKNGKVYNCDLNASYNIASRYFVRDILNHLSESEVSVLETKVSLKLNRTEVTYNTLIKLLSVMA